MFVLYHKDIDGFTAAWVAHLKHPNATYIPVNHGDSPPDVTRRAVIIVDFSFPKAVLLKMERESRSLYVLDHHASAQRDLEGLPFCHFDSTKSGARLAWDYFMGSPPPPLVQYVEDRDLWRWELPKSREISAYLSTRDWGFDEWAKINQRMIDDIDPIATLGEVALKVTQQYVAGKIAQATNVEIQGHVVPCINTTFAMSEVVGALADNAPFAMGWFQLSTGEFQYSLRSAQNGVDVSEIAKKYGGGGHKHAAGFTLNTLLVAVARNYV